MDDQHLCVLVLPLYAPRRSAFAIQTLVARKHPAYLYTFPLHARRAVLDTMLAEQAVADLAFHPAFRALAAGKAFWTELGRALQHFDAPTVAATCEVVADTLHARRITARAAATLVRDWRLGRLGTS